MGPRRGDDYPVSIPLRKFPREEGIEGRDVRPLCFHSTKEVSKEADSYPAPFADLRFHSTKEVSKGRKPRLKAGFMEVSIPLRKFPRPIRNVGTHVYLV